MTKLSGQTLVVIGGTSGMGLAVVEHCAQQGARVVVAGRTAEKLESAFRRVPSIQNVVADVSKEVDIANLFSRMDIFNHEPLLNPDKNILQFFVG
jgi:NAD(P)-dependent dehydrogenase (short-subunit alcohol dehydrogenase family)